MAAQLISAGVTDRPLRGGIRKVATGAGSFKDRPRAGSETRARAPAPHPAIMLQQPRRDTLCVTTVVAIDSDAALADFAAARD